MRHLRYLAAMFLALATSEAAHACRHSADLELSDVRYADVVLVGKITNYGIVRDKSYYAHFDVHVDQLLVGKAPRTVSVRWHNSTFELPKELPGGQFLIALRDPKSDASPLRGPSATILPNREPKSLTVLQAPCSSPFMFENTSENARSVRRILSARKR